MNRAHNSRIARFRYNVSIPIAGLLGLFGAVPLATSGFETDKTAAWAYPLLLILLLPIAAMVWGWRAGTDADAAGLRIRARGLGSDTLAWSEIVGIVPQERRVYAILADDRAIPLPAVTRTDIPRLVGASGQQIAKAESETESDDATALQ